MVMKDIEVAETAIEMNNDKVNEIIDRERDTYTGVKSYTVEVAETLAEVKDRVRSIEAIESVKKCFD